MEHDTLLDWDCEPGHTRAAPRRLQCKAGVVVPAPPACQEQPAAEQPQPPRSELPLFDESQACSPPEDRDGALLFLAKQEEESRLLEEAELLGNTTELLREDILLDPLEVEEEEESFYPNGTVIKFDCAETVPGQLASWEVSRPAA